MRKILSILLILSLLVSPVGATEKYTVIKNSFTAGELSPKLWARPDLAQFYNGVAKMENFYVQPYGGAFMRPGTEFVASTKGTGTTRLIEFSFSNTDSYIIEMGDQYMRFYRNSAQILMPTISSWVTSTAYVVDDYVVESDLVYICATAHTSGTFATDLAAAKWTLTTIPVTDWVTGTAYVVGDWVIESDTKYYCIVAHTSGTFATDLAANKWVAQSIYEIPTDYAAADLFDIKYTQNADLLFLAHNDYPPATLSRTGHTNWSIADITFTTGPFQPENTTTTTLDPSNNAGAITIVASADVFNDDHVGAFFSIGGEQSDTQGYVKITAVTDAQNVSATVISHLSTADATDEWSEGSFSVDAGFPAAVNFFEQRLFWGGTDDEPQTIWGSKTTDYYNMEDGPDGDDALVYEMFSNDVNIIRWIDGTGRVMTVGTSGGPFILWSGSNAEPLTPDMVSAKKTSNFGCANIRPVRMDSRLLFIQRGAEKMRELKYDFEMDGYIADDMTILADHILAYSSGGSDSAGVIDMAFQKLPIPLVWCVREEGEIAILSREVSQEVQAWSHITPGSPYVSGSPKGASFKSVAMMPNTEEDQVWTIASWNDGSTTRQFVCYFSSFGYATLPNYRYLDFAQVNDRDDVFSGGHFIVTGLDHLEGATVHMWGINSSPFIARGYAEYIGSVAVSSGTADISVVYNNYETIVTGIGYDKEIDLLPPVSKKGIDATFTHMSRYYGLFIIGYRTSNFRAKITRPYSANYGSTSWDIDYDFLLGQTLPKLEEDWYARNKNLKKHYWKLPLSGWTRDGIIEIDLDPDEPDYLNLLSLTLYVALGGE